MSCYSVHPKENEIITKELELEIELCRTFLNI